MNLKEAKAVVTGGTSGIGLEIAQEMRRQGAEVVICGRSEETVRAAADDLGVHGCRADVAVEEDVEALFRFALEKMGGVNVLINNAGLGFFSPLADTATEDLMRILDINVKGVFLAGRAAARIFIAQKSGNIINIGSTAALRGFANGSVYVASKFAVSGLTECWRAELRPHNIRVMQINPSEVITDFGPKVGMTQTATDRKLKPTEIAHLATAMLTMSDIGFIPEASVWATNP